MTRPIINDAHRAKRREMLAPYDLEEPRLLDVEIEFGPQAFNTRDLYELYLADFIKALPPSQQAQMMFKYTAVRDFAVAHASASAHSMMLMYMILKPEANNG